jgi:competence protein ComEC
MQSWMIGMVSGTIFAGFWPALPPWHLSILLAFIGLIGLIFRSRLARFISGVACGCVLGIAHGNALLEHRLLENCVGEPLNVTGHVASLPREGRTPGAGLRQRFAFAVDAISPERCAGPRKLQLFYYGDEEISPGAEWQFDVKLRKPWGLVNPGSFNMQAWFAQEGIDAVGSVRKSGLAQKLHSAQGSFGAHNRLRQKIGRHIRALDMDPDVAAILQALTVADKSAIDQSLWSLFQKFGINHLLVISGLHVGMVAAIGYLIGGIVVRLLQPVGNSVGWLPGVFALVLASLFAALAGFSLPTQRALCILACFVFAAFIGRKSDPSKSLLLAAMVVLVLNPLAALGSGFWLSFGSVAALFWLARWQQGIGVAKRLLGTHAFMSVLMLPMGALFFAGGSMVAMMANLLMIPLVGWFVVPLALTACVSFLCGWSFEGVLWQLAGWPMAQLLPQAETLIDRAGQWLYLPLNANWLQALLGILGVCLLVLPGVGKLKLLALTLILSALLPAPQSTTKPTINTEVIVLDVGQGTAVLIRSGNHALLYDTGGGDPGGPNMGTRVVLPFFQTEGIARLDTMVISHPDLDHSAGAAAILEALTVDRYRYGGEVEPGRDGSPCITGEAWRWPGGQTFQFLSPAQEDPLGSNDSSCVLQVQVGNYRLLLPGDIEADQERSLVQYWGEQLSSDWLLAAHHGSRTSSSQTILKYISPETVVVSSGYANRFGHPHWSVVQRLDGMGATVLDTSTSGALKFELTPGKQVRVVAYRRLARRYWM